MSLSLVKMQLQSIDNQIDTLEQYGIFMKDVLKSEEEKLDDRMAKFTKKMSPEEAEEYAEWYSDEYWMIADTFTQLANRSTLVMIWSSFETVLVRLARAFKRDRKLTPGLDGMKGKGLDKIERYFSGVINYDLKKDNQLWLEIRALNKIRNAIVHRASRPGDKIINLGKWKQIWASSTDNDDLDLVKRKKLDKAISDPIIKNYCLSGKIEIEDAGPFPREVIITSEYLIDVLDILGRYYEMLRNELAP